MFGFLSQAQHVVSGLVPVQDDLKWKSSVSLYKVSLEDDMTPHGEVLLATVPIHQNGFFSFDSSLFDRQERVYKIQVNSPESSHEIGKTSRLFILSKEDSLTLQLNNGEVIWTNSNVADVELQNMLRMKSYYENLKHPANNQVYKDYVKDSMQILLVKLMGVNLLNEKKLLDKDIEKNQAYYLALIQDFKSSEIEPAAYAFLETRCAVVGHNILRRKYNRSLFFNGIAVFLIVGLALAMYQIRSRQSDAALTTAPVKLSKQESIIKELIRQGKSNKEIATELFVSVSTVKTHITNLYSKLGIASRKEILAEA